MADLETSARLIDAGIDLFGRDGLSAVGTRTLAEAAGVQLSAIAYHFRTKDRLYLACAEHIAEYIRAKVTPLLERVGQTDTPLQARAGIETIIGGLTDIMLRDDVAPIVRFVVREQMSPSPAFILLYNGAIRHVIEPMGDLLRAVAGDRLSKEEIAVRCHILIGQVLGLRFTHATLLQATGWEAVGPREIAIVRDGVLANVRAVLDDLEMGSGR